MYVFIVEKSVLINSSHYCYAPVILFHFMQFTTHINRPISLTFIDAAHCPCNSVCMNVIHCDTSEEKALARTQTFVMAAHATQTIAITMHWVVHIILTNCLHAGVAEIPLKNSCIRIRITTKFKRFVTTQTTHPSIIHLIAILLIDKPTKAKHNK